MRCASSRPSTCAKSCALPRNSPGSRRCQHPRLGEGTAGDPGVESPAGSRSGMTPRVGGQATPPATSCTAAPNWPCGTGRRASETLWPVSSTDSTRMPFAGCCGEFATDAAIRRALLARAAASVGTDADHNRDVDGERQGDADTAAPARSATEHRLCRCRRRAARRARRTPGCRPGRCHAGTVAGERHRPAAQVVMNVYDDGPDGACCQRAADHMSRAARVRPTSCGSRSGSRPSAPRAPGGLAPTSPPMPTSSMSAPWRPTARGSTHMPFGSPARGSGIAACSTNSKSSSPITTVMWMGGDDPPQQGASR